VRPRISRLSRPCRDWEIGPPADPNEILIRGDGTVDQHRPRCDRVRGRSSSTSSASPSITSAAFALSSISLARRCSRCHQADPVLQAAGLLDLWLVAPPIGLTIVKPDLCGPDIRGMMLNIGRVNRRVGTGNPEMGPNWGGNPKPRRTKNGGTLSRSGQESSRGRLVTGSLATAIRCSAAFSTAGRGGPIEDRGRQAAMLDPAFDTGAARKAP